MTFTVPVSKDLTAQQPIPSGWRPTLTAIGEALKDQDFGLGRSIPGVPPLSPEDAESIQANILDYGAQWVCVTEQSWLTSVCQWMDGYWDVLIDLATDEGPSDLVLSVRVTERGEDRYLFAVQMVYVP